MKPLTSLLILLFCLCGSQADAQFSSIEAYGGVGAFSVPDEFFTSTTTSSQFISIGEGFILRQQGTQTAFTSTRYKSGQSIHVGVEGHYSVGIHGSIYAGVRLQAALLRYEEGDASFENFTFGPIDTMFLEPNGGTIGSGITPLVFCPGNSFGFSSDAPDRAFALDVGIPVGYRHRFFNDRIAFRAQGSVNIPVFSRHASQTSSLQEDVVQGCFRFEETNGNTSSAYSLNSFVFRAGMGLDFSLSHSLNLGLMVEQQFNSTVESSDSFIVDEGRFVSVPEITKLNPLSVSLVGRVLIR